MVASPIGNLEDLTLRASRVLKEADLIAAEDTRRTRQLLSHLGIKARVVSYREQNQAKTTPKLIEALLSGKDLALITDAGTPALSDPGHRLVRAAHQAGVKVVPVPGPSALVAALSVCGLPAARFFFTGFLPAKKGPRRKYLEELAGRTETLVFFEAPHRLKASLKDLAEILGPREAVLARELTKLNEEVRFSNLAELAEGTEALVKGEVTLVVAGLDQPASQADQKTIRRVWLKWRGQGLSASQAAREAARELRLAKAKVYRLVQEDDS